jgi:hypothetical protein
VIARIAGGLLIGGLAGLLVAVALAPGGGAVLSSELPEPGGTTILIPVFLALVAAGSISLTWSDEPIFFGRALALGLRSLSIGLFTLSGVLLAFGSSGVTGTGVDVLLVPLVGGALAAVAGAVATGLALIRETGRARATGLVLLSGLVLVVIGNWARNGNPPAPLAVAIGTIGLLVTGIGGLALGVLGVISRGPARPPEA